MIFSPKPPTDIDTAKVADRAPETNKVEMKDGHSEDGEDMTDESKNTPVNVPNSALNFSFVGFGPGKSHTGTFEEYEIKDVIVNESGIPVSGMVVFETDSVKTDSSVLDGHLCEKDNFLNCSVNKQITFDLKEIISENGSELEVVGDLSFRGIVKEIAFPVTIEGNQASADFKINVSDFGFSAAGIVNKEVQIKFTGTL